MIEVILALVYYGLSYSIADQLVLQLQNSRSVLRFGNLPIREFPPSTLYYDDHKEYMA